MSWSVNVSTDPSDNIDMLSYRDGARTRWFTQLRSTSLGFPVEIFVVAAIIPFCRHNTGRWRRLLRRYTTAILRRTSVPGSHPTNMASDRLCPHALFVCMILVVMATDSSPIAAAVGDVSPRRTRCDVRWMNGSDLAGRKIDPHCRPDLHLAVACGQ